MDPIIPKPKPPKPYTVEQFKKSADTLLQGVYGTGKSSNAFLVDLIQKELDKGIDEGVITMEEGIKFLKERKNYYDTELGKQEGEKKRMPPAYGEVEERVNFLDGGDTEYNALVTKKYIELGGKEGTGMDIDKFAEEYFPKMADGGRINFDEGTSKDFNRNPGGKNQFTGKMKSIEEIKNIIDNSPDNFTAKDFRGEGKLNNPELGKDFKGKLLTRDDLQRAKEAGIEPKFKGKRVFKPSSKLISNKKYNEFIKTAQGSMINMDKVNNFGHFAPKLKTFLTSTANTGPIKASVNRAAQGYDAKILEIAERQQQLVLEKPKGFEKLLDIENAKAKKLSKDFNKLLPKELKGTLGYFTVSPQGEFKLKAVDRAKTFAGISDKEKFYKTDMTPSERKSFGKEQASKFGKYVKPIGKVALRAVSPFVPVLGTAGMVMGGADVAKAADQGMKNEELGIAYLAGPEVAQNYKDLKARVKGKADETKTYVP